MKIGKTILAAAAAFLLSAAAWPGISASAAESFIPGDVNCNGRLDFQDIAYIRNWLYNPSLCEANVQNGMRFERADINGNGTLDAADLTLMKQEFFRLYGTDNDNWPGGNAPSPEEAEDTWLPISKAYEHQLQSTGERRVLMIVFDFPDYPRADQLTAEEIQARCFGPEDKDSPAYPFESISAYYDRASGGKLKLSGDVFTYAAKGGLTEYYRKYGEIAGRKIVSKNTALLLKEALDSLSQNEGLNLSDYDSDGNGCLDAVIAILPHESLVLCDDILSQGNPDWWPGYEPAFEYELVIDDGEAHTQREFYLIRGASDLRDQASFNSTYAHELGHAMGLDDLYRTDAPAGEQESMHGEAGFALMEDGTGDLTAFSKVRLGWCTPENMQVYTGGVQTFTLNSNQTAPDFLVIPKHAPAEGETFCFEDEYFIVELNTPENNCARAFEAGGVRLLRFSGTKFSLLVSDGDGFYLPTETVDGDAEGFCWADGSALGITIKVGEITGGKVTLTVSPIPDAELPPGETPPVAEI